MNTNQERSTLLNGTGWLRWLAILIAAGTLAVTLWPAPGSTSAYSIGVIHRTNLAVASAQACQRHLDQDRRPDQSRHLYAHTDSMAFRRWALRLWKGRAVKCARTTRHLNALPPRAIVYVFDRIGQTSTALTVAGREAGSGDIWKHPFCTGASNGTHDGCFQFGGWAKNTFGFGQTALDQTWAAYRYVVHDGNWCGGWAQTAPGC